MASPDKVATVQELQNRFSNSSGVVLTEYRGLSVAAVQKLRRSLGQDATYAVSKNTLTQIAAHQAGVEGIDDLLVGPTAIAFIDGDPVNVAKGLRNFAKENPFLVIKGGVLDGKVLSTEEIGKLADLESREVLLAKLAGAMNAAPQKAVSLLAAPLAQAARVLGALENAAKENPSLIGGAGEAQDDPAAPAAEQASDAPAADETSAAADAADPADAATAAEEK